MFGFEKLLDLHIYICNIFISVFFYKQLIKNIFISMAFSYFVWIKHPTFLSIAFAVAQIRLSANNKIVDEVEKDPCVLFFYSLHLFHCLSFMRLIVFCFL